jgi:hypothetical protein
MMAQQAADALRLSQYYAGGTARAVAMSGAFGALGGDLSTLSTNPGGLAVYRGSEFTITPTFNTASTNIYDNTTFNERNTRFILNNIGYVYTWNRHNPKGLQSINFGIAYNRLGDFNRSAYIRTPHAGSSLLDEFVWYANGAETGVPVSPDGLNSFYEGLAYDSYAINWDEDDGYYYSDYKVNRYNASQKHTMSARGGIGEYGLSLGANINHTWFLGATLGIQNVDYEEYYLHEESPGFQTLDYFNFSDDFTIDGWGLNFKAGVIYRPVHLLRLGLAVHTPTHYWLKPYHLTGMHTVFNEMPPDADKKDFYWETESDVSERFQISTPWRYSASAAVVSRFGLLNVDVEYLDYATGRISPNSDYNENNNDIANIYRNAVNVKAGAEARLSVMYFRAGMAYYGSPYESSDIKGTLSYSAGLGFRVRDFYIDAGYSYMKHPRSYHTFYTSYDAADNVLYDIGADISSVSNKVAITFGFKF